MRCVPLLSRCPHQGSWYPRGSTCPVPAASCHGGARGRRLVLLGCIPRRCVLMRDGACWRGADPPKVEALRRCGDRLAWGGARALQGLQGTPGRGMHLCKPGLVRRCARRDRGPWEPRKPRDPWCPRREVSGGARSAQRGTGVRVPLGRQEHCSGKGLQVHPLGTVSRYTLPRRAQRSSRPL